LDEKGFWKEGFILKIVSNRKDKDKPLEGFSMLYEGLSKFEKCIIKPSVCDKVKVEYNLRVA
jgi:hypothetical protein